MPTHHPGLGGPQRRHRPARAFRVCCDPGWPAPWASPGCSLRAGSRPRTEDRSGRNKPRSPSVLRGTGLPRGPSGHCSCSPGCDLRRKSGHRAPWAAFPSPPEGLNWVFCLIHLYCNDVHKWVGISLFNFQEPILLVFYMKNILQNLKSCVVFFSEMFCFPVLTTEILSLSFYVPDAESAVVISGSSCSLCADRRCRGRRARWRLAGRPRPRTLKCGKPPGACARVFPGAGSLPFPKVGNEACA